MKWRTARRVIDLERPLVMGILNVTPDSFSDGGSFADTDAAVRRAGEMVQDGVDIIDIGGQSTRPGSDPIDLEEELRRVVPAIKAITENFDVPVSVDTFQQAVAAAALESGAEILNDISGLRWSGGIAELAASAGAGLVLMHSRGSFETMHSEPAVQNIMTEVVTSLSASVDEARQAGVDDEQIVLDVGIGFGKTQEQNLELIAKLDKIAGELENFPLLVGASRKSFIGRITGETEPAKRLGGSLAAAIAAAEKGARVIRVHDVKETVEALNVLRSINENSHAKDL